MMIHIANPIYDSVFKDKHNRQVLNVDEEQYAGDTELQYILHRLLAAASDAKLRQDMNVEDEYFSAIENRDTAIMNRDKKIKEQDETIEQQGAKIEQQDARIEQQDAKIEQQDAKIEQQGAEIEQLQEHKNHLRNLVQSLLKSGMTIEQIAQATNTNPQELQDMLTGTAAYK